MLSLLPLRWLHTIGCGLGLLVYRLFSSRRRIANRNIELCFPELSKAEHTDLTRQHFIELGRSVMSTGLNWFASTSRLDKLFTVEGRENLEAVLNDGDNVILLAPHFIALEIGGIYLSRQYPTVSMYQFVKNPIMDETIRTGRCRFGAELVERKAPMRNLIRTIRSGRLFYYLPDQDPGRRKGVFVPFFGIETATFPMLSRFAKMSRARVVPCLTEQLDKGKGFKLTLLPALTDFPGDDEIEDTRRMNTCIEEAIRLMPAQYFWVHKRFKTRPEGQPSVY
ncbi:MAG: lipid A biosynthesis lauroyltransferase [marine bacterium B5-7]|nr:MAG: lipid A biosynthesis lauroyltransferase [marine bacterium B5-7]